MGFWDHYKGTPTDYDRHPFPHSLLRIRETTGFRVSGFLVAEQVACKASWHTKNPHAQSPEVQP